MVASSGPDCLKAKFHYRACFQQKESGVAAFCGCMVSWVLPDHYPSAGVHFQDLLIVEGSDGGSATLVLPI